MSYVETPSHIIVTIDAAADGTFRAGNVERYATVTMDGQPRPDVVTRDVITADTLPVLLPQAALMVQVEALTAARDAAVTAKAAAEGAKQEADAALAAAQARIADLEAQLSPVDQNGFAVLSAVQVRLALLAAGIRASQVQAIIDAIADPVQRETAHTYWDYAVELHRNHPMIAMFAAALGLTDEQVDTMWHAAAAL